ncbi:tyrosine-type recombinase/integrase [Lacrimispora indolis]|uniref:tyrosine-type recombinase/integrase n=1 Tax=Lacrimispora indolis TaxID=69825 RepID=UPI00045E6F2C|nr:site-specific integrase [Lacrimispora indolis]
MTNEEILQKLEEEIYLRGFSPHTQEEYIIRAKSFMLYADRPLEELTEQDIRAFLIYLLNVKKLSAASVNGYNSALRFLFGAILHRHLNFYDIPHHKHVYTYPTVLTMQEVQRILDAADSLRDKTMLMTIYGAGLRVSEIINLKTSDIYASSMRILIRQGKGKRDRFTLLSKTNLDILTQYWYAYKPKHSDHYLFLNRSKNKMTTRAAGDIFRKALRQSGVHKPATIHTLRHCFATHLLENGTDLCQIKNLLGHTNIKSTARYLHLSNFEENLTSPLDTLFLKSEVQ